MRTSIKTLEALVLHLNQITGNPETPWTRKDNKLTANVDNYHLDQAYGGVRLDQMDNEGGGVHCPLGCGYDTKRDLEGKLRAYMNGIGIKLA